MNKIPMSNYKSLLLSLRRIVSEVQKKKKQNLKQQPIINKTSIKKLK